MLDRRSFLKSAAAASGTVPMTAGVWAGEKPKPFSFTKIGGKPRERGRQYGKAFEAGIRGFLDREIYGAFIQKPSPKEAMLRYAGACGQEIKAYAPVIHDELEGVADGSGLKFEEVVLITLHEELYHKGVLPKVPHCTAVGLGPPVTTGGGLVGQTWDWMETVAGMSSMVHWKRPEGPSLLAYGFPGLWTGAGLNSAGLALCWTSAELGVAGQSARVGIPSYVLLTHLLYQESLEAVAKEARRATNAGWFTFVMGDAKGNLLNIEGSPDKTVAEAGTGKMFRVGFGSREMTKTPAGKDVAFHARCRAVDKLLTAHANKVDRRHLQGWFADAKGGIAVGRGTIDLMVFDTTAKEAFVARGPSYGVTWQKFDFGTT